MIFRGTTAQALAQLQRMTAADKEPLLSSAELGDLLNMARRPDSAGVSPEAEVWTAGRAYAAGDLVLPTASNGHYYEVTTAGTGDASEPAWPTGSGQTVTDNGVVFTEAGAASWVRTYDLSWAAAEGWSIKEGRAAHRTQHLQDGRAAASDYLVLNCRAKKEEFRNQISASLPVRTGRRAYATGLTP